jgi:hypothetical protein
MLPTLFIPHGGGPLPLLGDPGHTGLVKFLKAVPSQIQPKPKAILLVSAHWEVCDSSAVHCFLYGTIDLEMPVVTGIQGMDVSLCHCVCESKLTHCSNPATAASTKAHWKVCLFHACLPYAACMAFLAFFVVLDPLNIASIDLANLTV